MSKVVPIPEGFHTITPTLVVKDAEKAIKTYEKAFGAKLLHKMNCPQSGKVMHSCLQIGDSRIFVCDESPQMGCMAGTNTGFYLYFKDSAAAHKQAVQAGLKELSKVEDMFWGDRVGRVQDQFGVDWSVATHVREVSPEEMAEGAKKMASGKKAA